MNTATSPQDISIRPATGADIADLAALVETAYRGEPARAGWTHEADLLGGQRTDAAMLEELIDAPRSRILVERHGEGLTGCVHIRAEGTTAHLGLLAVRPGLQGTGLGKRLIAAAEAEVRRVWDATVMRMSVLRPRTELIAYYERRGYAVTGETAPFPYGDERFGQPKREDLDFVILEKALA